VKNWLRRWLGMETVFVIHISEMKPDDVLIVHSDSPLSGDTCAHIREMMAATFPGKKCLVMSDGLKLGILSPTK
jgi:hypothetical protein